MTALNHLTCCQCGIHFGFDLDVEKSWRRDKHGFNCPNGHSNFFIVTPTESEKELVALRIEVKALKERLSASVSETEVLMHKVAELEGELEIYGIKSKE